MEPDVLKAAFTNEERPAPVHVTDTSVNLDMDVKVIYAGSVSFEMKDKSYGDISGIVGDSAKTAFTIAISSLQPEEIDPRDLAPLKPRLCKAASERMRSEWERRGVNILGIQIEKLEITEESAKFMNQLYEMNELRDPAKLAKKLEEATQAAKAAAIEEAKKITALGDIKWKCPKCGAINEGKFCMECGTKREWTCSCGTVNTGRFCTECGKARALVDKSILNIR